MSPTILAKRCRQFVLSGTLSSSMRVLINRASSPLSGDTSKPHVLKNTIRFERKERSHNQSRFSSTIKLNVPDENKLAIMLRQDDVKIPGGDRKQFLHVLTSRVHQEHKVDGLLNRRNVELYKASYRCSVRISCFKSMFS